MNVIFLDIDGVLNHSETHEMSHAVWKIDADNVARFNRLVDNVEDLTIVLSSSWRYAVAKKFIDINELLKEQGYKGPEIVERTICDNELEEAEPSMPRGLEIERWVKAHPEVKDFIILDDDDDMEHLMPNLIQTAFDEGGLLDSHVNKAIERLRQV